MKKNNITQKLIVLLLTLQIILLGIQAKNRNKKGIPRDLNAAINIKRERASSLGLGDVRQLRTAIAI